MTTPTVIATKRRGLATLATATCEHEGAVLEECRSCSPERRELRHVRACNHEDTPHTRCTRAANNGANADVGACDSCPFHSSRQRAVARRHLIYHIYPARGSEWRQRLRAVTDRWHLFDATHHIAVAVGPQSDSAEEVRAALPAGAIMREFANDPELRELVSWRWLWDSALSAAGDDDAILRGHAKGVSRGGGPCQLWARLCESLCLDHWPVVQRQLAARPITGPFRVRHDRPGWNEDGRCDWLYSGSWYWARAGAVRAKDLTPKQNSWGVESWPGREFRQHESGVIFGDVAPVLPNDLYANSTWEERLFPQYQAWRAAHPPDPLPLAEPLHVVTPCARPQLLPGVAASLAHLAGIDYRWHVVHAGTPGFGGAARTASLRDISDGWVWFLDDDNAVHRDFAVALTRAVRQHPTADGFVFGQLHRDGSPRLEASITGRTGEIDTGQFVFRRSAIGSTSWGDGYTADGEFFREVAARCNIIAIPEFVTNYNALSG